MKFAQSPFRHQSPCSHAICFAPPASGESFAIICHQHYPSGSSASAHALSDDPLSPLDSDFLSAHGMPSDMYEEASPPVECILAIEAAVEDMRGQSEVTHLLLQDLIQRLDPAQAQNVPDRPQRPQSRHPSPVT